MMLSSSGQNFITNGAGKLPRPGGKNKKIIFSCPNLLLTKTNTKILI